MKNSKEYAQKINKLYRSLKKKESKVKRLTFEDALEALVVGAVSEHVQEQSTKDLLKKLNSHFADYNDLRVSRTEEILEVIGITDKGAKEAASMIPKVLNAVFNKFDRLSLDALKGAGKRQSRKEIAELEDISRFVESFCFLTAMDGHTIPLTQKMVSFLKEEEYVHPESSEDEISSFLERQISSSNNYEFYFLLRQHCESGAKSTVKKTRKKTTKKTKKKTTKKKTTKKKKSSK